VSSILPLGRQYNLVTSATTANTRVNLRNASGVLFVLIGATSGNATIQEHNASTAGTSQNLSAITEYYTASANSAAWTRTTQAAAATFAATTGGLACAWVPQGALSDTFSWVSASHASGSFVYIIGDLDVARKVANLASAL
jgi:hypothetical protein